MNAKRRQQMKCLILATLLLGLLCRPALAAAPPLNFIFILVDDLGATDLGCYGSKFYETPHLDRLAREGMKFTQAYAACTVCSPTRAALLTGKWPARLHLTDWIAGHQRPFAKLKVPDWTLHLPLAEVTIAEALKPTGYATAHIGKWHLGKEEFYPTKQGFDVNFGGTDKGQPPSYFSPYKIATLPDGPPGEFLTDREAAEACQFITANRDQPFFIYLSHYAVHTPLQGKQEVIAKYQAKAGADSPQKNATYAALVESVDDSLGRITKTLAELQLTERTVIFFTSDNGGLTLNHVTHNLGLRAGKGSAYEGGVRVPLIVKWPGTTKPGSVCETPVITVDFHPTMLAIAGLKPQAQPVVDGESLVPLLQQSGPLKRDAIYWHYPHYHPGGATPYAAIRQGDCKLIEFYEDNHSELYNLRTDPLEQSDLAPAQPQKADELKARLHAWQRQTGAQMAVPNPDYDEAKNRPGGAKKQQ